MCACLVVRIVDCGDFFFFFFPPLELGFVFSGGAE